MLRSPAFHTAPRRHLPAHSLRQSRICAQEFNNANGVIGEKVCVMLTSDEWVAWASRLGLADIARQKIAEIRSSEPVRHVQGRGGNVCARYPSWKMGHVVQAESHTVELVGIRCGYEFDDTVLEYWDQPCKLKLNYATKSGKPVAVFHTPDFLVLRTTGATFEEWKAAETLPALAEQMPGRYVPVGGAGSAWRCPPGEVSARELGLSYRVRTSTEFSLTFQRNIAFLEDYLQDCLRLRPDAPVKVNTPMMHGETRRKIVDAVQAHFGITVAQLLQAFDADAIYAAIAAHAIHVDLTDAPLAEPEHVHVFHDADVAQAFVAVQTAHVMAKEPMSTPSTQTTTNSGRVRAHDLILQASPVDLREANERYHAVLATLAGETPTTTMSARTLRHYLRRYREAESIFGSGYLGLITLRARKGNRTAKLPKCSEALLQQYIEGHYETLKQKSIRQAYGEYVLACERKGVSPASRITFGKRVRTRPRAEQVRKRQGDRAAYACTPFASVLTSTASVWRLEATTPRHGDFPWQIAHLDHSELDIELVCAKTGRNLGRPWLTLMIDAFSRRILAVHLSFDPPSYRACMMVMIECVRRHSRLPQTLVVDNGPEFGSVYFEALLARYAITKLTRPAAQPRFGSIIERLLQTSDSTFIHNLQGNTQITRLVRLVTKPVDPKTQAIWTLGELHDYLWIWAYEVYDQLDHPALSQTPREAFLVGLAISGSRPHRRVEFDEAFRILTLPTTVKGTAKVVPSRGVKINYLFYWCDAFRQRTIEETRVPVRFDPFNAGLAYAYVNAHWTQCVSEHYATFHNHSEREIMLASQILRQRQRQHQRQTDIRAKLLANFILSAEAEELLLEQRLRDNEARQLQAAVLSAPSSPPVNTEVSTPALIGATTAAMDPALSVALTQSASALTSSSMSAASAALPRRINRNDLEQYGEIVW